jgi:type II secretory pathway pseudopilin PulG
VLLTLMMIAAMVLVVLAAAIPYLKQQVQRDREEEMIHRGVQYSRAIRKYYKKFGRYPVRIEDLENTNNLRFLRKRYKDPLTGKDFKFLHFGEVQMAFGAGIAGGVAPGANAMGSVAPPPPPKGSQPQGTDTQDSPDSASANASTSNGPGAPAGAGGPLNAAFGGQTFGGGPIVGVVSTSKKKSIREFNKKDHYNQWQFIYDPGTDRGGLLNSPAQPALQNPAAAQGQPAQPGQSPQGGAPGVPVLGGGGGAQQPGNPQPPQQPPDMNQQ